MSACPLEFTKIIFEPCYACMKLLMKLTDDSKQTSSPWSNDDGPPIGTASKILLSWPFPCLDELRARLEGEGMPYVLDKRARGAGAAADEPSSLFADGSDDDNSGGVVENNNDNSGMLIQRSVSFILKDEIGSSLRSMMDTLNVGRMTSENVPQGGSFSAARSSSLFQVEVRGLCPVCLVASI